MPPGGGAVPTGRSDARSCARPAGSHIRSGTWCSPGTPRSSRPARRSSLRTDSGRRPGPALDRTGRPGCHGSTRRSRGRSPQTWPPGRQARATRAYAAVAFHLFLARQPAPRPALAVADRGFPAANIRRSWVRVHPHQLSSSSLVYLRARASGPRNSDRSSMPVPTNDLRQATWQPTPRPPSERGAGPVRCETEPLDRPPARSIGYVDRAILIDQLFSSI